MEYSISHKRKLQVDFNQVNHMNRIRLDCLLNMMQLTAWEHADNNRLGMDLYKEKKFWALSRLVLVIDSLPKWQDEIVVETWAKKLDSIIVHRDFKVSYANGESICRSASVWALVDVEKRRPLKMELVKDRVPLKLEDALEELPAKIVKPKDLVSITRNTIQYSHLDLNQHTNNVAYVNFILDSLPEEFHENKRLRKFTINFKAESKLHDEIEISQTQENDHSFKVFGGRISDQKEVFRSELIFQD